MAWCAAAGVLRLLPDSAVGPPAWFDFSSRFAGAGIRALLSRRDGAPGSADFDGVDLDEHRRQLAAALGIEPHRLAVPRQVHGNRVEQASPGRLHAETDGLITGDPDTVLTLQVADCVPLFLYHPATGRRGLVHAGWRGAAGQIANLAVQQMAEAGSPAHELVAFLGPCIEQDCYAVGPEVGQQFDPALSRSNTGGGYQLDIAGALRQQLGAAGVPAAQVHSAGICTHCDQAAHSYRRDGHRAGRMIAFFYQNGA